MYGSPPDILFNFAKILKWTKIMSEQLITDINEIVLKEYYLITSEQRKMLLNNLMPDLKLCLKEEKYQYIDNYKKLLGLDLLALLEMIIYLFSHASNKDLLYFALKALTKKYKNLLISDYVINSYEIKNPNYSELLF